MPPKLSLVSIRRQVSCAAKAQSREHQEAGSAYRRGSVLSIRRQVPRAAGTR